MAPALDFSFLRSRVALRRIALVTLAAAASGAIYGLLAPKWYRSVLTVVPASSPKPTGLSSLLGGDLGSLAGSLGGSSEVPRIGAVLQSVAVTDSAIEKFDLRTRYDVGSQEAARDELWDHCDVRILTKPNLVELSCEDRDPQFVQALLTHFAEYGNQVFRRVSVTSASEEVRFLEKRSAELRRQADEAAERMRGFQEKHQIVDLESQARAVVSSVAVLHSQRVMKKTELDYARRFSSPDEPGVRQLESQLSVVDDRLLDLEAPLDRVEKAGPGTPAAKDRRTGMFPAALAVPALRAEFEKLYRDRKVAETTLVFSLDRLESARATEARDVSTFQVLDPPTIPTRRSRPKRGLIVAGSALLGLALSLSWEARRARRAPADGGGDSAARPG